MVRIFPPCFMVSALRPDGRRQSLAYSQDVNPIRMMWSKVKSHLRLAQTRTDQDLLSAIASALRAVTPQDARGWFAACGYSII
jgi:hypothetical protein